MLSFLKKLFSLDPQTTPAVEVKATPVSATMVEAVKPVVANKVEEKTVAPAPKAKAPAKPKAPAKAKPAAAPKAKAPVKAPTAAKPKKPKV